MVYHARKEDPMDQQPNYRRRRAAVAAGALALLAIAHHDEPTFGTLSIALDTDRAPRIEAALAPPLDAVAVAATFVAEQLAR